MRTTTTSTPGTQKVRREAVGSKRAPGWAWQETGRRVRRPNVTRLRVGKDDPSLSAVGGLVSFNQFVQGEGLGREFAAKFGHLKEGRRVVYPMAAQMQLLVDAVAAGARRVFDFEGLAGDPIFEYLAGGAVPSIDTIYDDLKRFGAEELDALEAIVAEQGLLPVRARKFERLTIDVDTSVMTVFGEQEGAERGYNPKHHGRRSYHPRLARIAETHTVFGARLRYGDTGLGDTDVEDLQGWLGRAQAAAPKAVVTMRMDAGGDNGAFFKAIDEKGAYFLIKMHQTWPLLVAVHQKKRWQTVDSDANGKPSRQVAELDFARADWPKGKYRVFAVRTNERLSGKQTELWSDNEFSVHVYVTNDHDRDLDELARLYDDRAGIEPMIAELKNGFAIGKVSTGEFQANEAGFLLKLLTYNLMQRWVAAKCPSHCHRWNATWIRRACVLVPARLLRNGGCWLVRLAPRPMLN